jgi:predicted anti-sigma-YlaC factor YlaD
MGRNGVDLSCDEVVRLVSDYLEGVLTRAEAARFEAHIVMCDGCAAYLDQMRDTIRLVGELPERSVPDATWNRLRSVFRDWKQSGPEQSSSTALTDTAES